MKHSEAYETIKKFFDEGRWNAKRVRDAVTMGKITPGEYEEITGELYAA